MTKWRTVDIIFASVIAAICGVINWAWSFLTSVFLFPITAFFQPIQAIFEGGWLLAGVLGGLIIRKPGAAFFTELVAATISMIFGTQWGFEVLLWGAIQGITTEAVFALFRYRNWNLTVAILAGVGAAIGDSILYQVIVYIAWEPSWRILAFLLTLISGAFIAGAGAYIFAKKLAKTGVLAQFESGYLT
ncbi:MAG: ECF transporter S component [Micrococcaceae bacterium]